MKINDLEISLTEGITHIEDLGEDEFLRAVKNLNSWEISEKVDGAALQFGFDKNGFFTAREKKGGEERYRDAKEWGTKFMSTGFRSSHDALKKLMTPLYKKRIIQAGDLFSVEILFGKLPNAVPYSGEINQIILLSKDSEEDTEKARWDLEKMNEMLEDKTVTISVSNVPYTDDGISIQRRDEEHEWVVAIVPKKRADNMSSEEARQIVDEEIKKIEELLDKKITVGAKEMPVREVISIPLNKKPDWLGDSNWKEIKAIVKEKQQKIKAALMKSKLEIKNHLLDAFVRKQQSEFGPSIKDGGWIEGVVAKDSEGNMTKIVDKEGFTALNNFNWLVRADIYDARNSESVVMKMRNAVADAMGHSPLAGSQGKRYAKKFGTNPEEQAINLATDVDFKNVRKVFVDNVKSAGKELSQNLEHFKNKTGPYADVDYSEGVKERTFQTFAETHELLNGYMKALKAAKTGEDLIVIFAGDKLTSIAKESIDKSLMESGRAIEGSGAIYINELGDTLKAISQVSDIPFSEIKNGVLGSVGKSKFSGDIDIALDDAMYDKKEIYDQLNAAGLNPRLMAVVSFPMKIAGYDESVNDQTDKERTGVVQVDFMFGKVDLLKFGYHSAGDKSQYKGMLRTVLIASVANAMSQLFYDEGSKELVGRFGPAFAPSTGINLRPKMRPRKKLTKKEIAQGITLASKPRLKGEKIVDIETFKKEFPSVEVDKFGDKWEMDNPDDIAQFLFGDVKPDVTAADLDSVETVLPLIKKKAPELQKLVLQRFKGRLKGDGVPIPKELENLTGKA